MDNIYSFIYRGVLTEEALDRAGRNRHRHFGAETAHQLRKSLCFDLLDKDALSDAERMSIVYTAIHTFENMVRALVSKAMADKHGVEWWQKVSEKIRKNVQNRMAEDTKFKWHGTRGATEMIYCDFGDLLTIIVNDWTVFEDVLANQEWAKGVLSTLEKSRNIVMHGGVLANEDIERIGMNIRDWIRQTG